MRRAGAVGLCVVLLTACAETPQGGSMPPAWKVCSPIELEQAVARLKAAWRQCFEGQSSHRLLTPNNAMAAGNAGGGAVVTERREGEVTVLTVNLQSRDFTGLRTSQQALLNAEFQMTPDCRTEVTARGANEHWHALAVRAADWLKEPPASASRAPCG